MSDECWSTSSTVSLVLCSCLNRSTSTSLLCFFPPSTLSALLYSYVVVVNKACPLASRLPVISSSVLGKELWTSYVGQVRLLVLHLSCICIKSTQAFQSYTQDKTDSLSICSLIWLGSLDFAQAELADFLFPLLGTKHETQDTSKWKLG